MLTNSNEDKWTFNIQQLQFKLLKKKYKIFDWEIIEGNFKGIQSIEKVTKIEIIS